MPVASPRARPNTTMTTLSIHSDHQRGRGAVRCPRQDRRHPGGTGRRPYHRRVTKHASDADSGESAHRDGEQNLDGHADRERTGNLPNLQSAQAAVRSAENALSWAVKARDQLVLICLQGGLSARSIARELGIDRRAIAGIKARAATTEETDNRAVEQSARAGKQANAATSWLGIAVRQVERAEAAEIDGMTDGMLAILAAHVATACAICALGRSHPAVADYLGDGEAGHEALKNSRDLMAHFDMYVEGDGNMQRAKVDGRRIPNPVDARPPLIHMWNGGSSQQLVFLTKTWVRDERGEYLLQDGKPLRHDDGTPWMETLQISLDLRDAISATATLVAEARSHAQLTDHEAVAELLRSAGV